MLLWHSARVEWLERWKGWLNVSGAFPLQSAWAGDPQSPAPPSYPFTFSTSPPSPFILGRPRQAPRWGDVRFSRYARGWAELAW